MNSDSSKPLRVAIVVPAKRFLCLGSLLWFQRYGPLQVASVVGDAGYFVRVFNEELGIRVSAEELACSYDVVGFSAKSSAIPRAEELAKHIKTKAKERGRQVVTVLGGEHASMCEDSRLSEYFDYVLPGESEDAFVFLLKALDLERGADRKVLHILPRRRFCTCQSFNNIPDLSLVHGYEETVKGFVFRYLPPLWALKNKMLPMLTFQGARGCPYGCSFCPTPRYLQGNEYRRRSRESAVSYLQEHIARSGIRRVIFEDPTAAIAFDEECHRFFESLAKSSIRMKATALVRADLCHDERLLKVMRAAGVANLSVGIESLNDQTRRDFKKKTSYDTIVRSIDIFHEHGFSVTGLFIVGYDTDDLDSFDRIEKFINETGIEKWKVSPLTQVLELPDQFMPAHRFFLWDEFACFDRDVIDYGNGEFVLFYPKYIKPSTLQKSIMTFNKSSTSVTGLIKLFISQKRLSPVLQRIGNNLAQRIIQNEVVRSNYIEMVQEVEKPFYVKQNGMEELQEDLLKKRYEGKDEVCQRIYSEVSKMPV